MMMNCYLRNLASSGNYNYCSLADNWPHRNGTSRFIGQIGSVFYYTKFTTTQPLVKSTITLYDVWQQSQNLHRIRVQVGRLFTVIVHYKTFFLLFLFILRYWAYRSSITYSFLSEREIMGNFPFWSYLIAILAVSIGLLASWKKKEGSYFFLLNWFV